LLQHQLLPVLEVEVEAEARSLVLRLYSPAELLPREDLRLLLQVPHPIQLARFVLIEDRQRPLPPLQQQRQRPAADHSKIPLGPSLPAAAALGLI
jgi:hypothetical protein